ncbi:sugar kinase, partial [Candidatus Micrarchaeota archaeon]|nr:sugar kinase [Candidatus Micrarchaeota archaeon]
GSLALDTIKTPFGEVKDALGGSAMFASVAASLFCKPAIVGVVGEDFPEEHLKMLEKRGIDISAVEKSDKGTFKWEGYYEHDLNVAHTVKTELNSFEHFEPKVPEHLRETPFVFLGNIAPKLQMSVIGQMKTKPGLSVSDTMNFWIQQDKKGVLDVIRKVDIGLMNDGEARMLFNTNSILKAAQEILKLDSDIAIIKKGEHGCVLYTDKTHFAAPGYPLEKVLDPTGAGDSFAGAFIGYLAKTRDLSEKNVRKAIIYGSTVASFVAEGFSIDNIKGKTVADIDERYAEFKKIVEF